MKNKPVDDLSKATRYDKILLLLGDEENLINTIWSEVECKKCPVKHKCGVNSGMTCADTLLEFLKE